MITEADVSIFQNRCVEFLAQKQAVYQWRQQQYQNRIGTEYFRIYPVHDWRTFKAKEPSSAIALLKSSSIHELYSAGRKKNRNKAQDGKAPSYARSQTLVRTANETYTSTLVDGIMDSFSFTTPTTALHEIHITADYPLQQSCHSSCRY